MNAYKYPITIRAFSDKDGAGYPDEAYDLPGCGQWRSCKRGVTSD